ncbi:MAG: choice-of-anchor tandem repeat GloVer-containing protein, partial [Bryobacteraceae bacterium]
ALSAVLVAGLPMQGQTLTILHSFTRNTGGGWSPLSGVVVGAKGELYGTTPLGGASNLGVAYKLIPPASPGGAWTENAIYSFGNQKEDNQPSAGLLLGPGGALYGVTGFGPNGSGTVFRLDPPTGTNRYWRETILYYFTGADNGLAGPSVGLTLGPDRTLYGAETAGGTAENGAVFSVTAPPGGGTPWTEAALYDFPGGIGGSGTAGSLARSADGALYGALAYGGVTGAGAMLGLFPPAVQGGGWSAKLLYSFGEPPDGNLPQGGVIIGPNGALFGTTEYGGDTPAGCRDGCGTVFELDPPASPGGAWTETILHAFTGAATGDGYQPNSTLVLGPGDVLYGTTRSGGASGLGTIFEMIPPPSQGDPWTELVLHSFTGGVADGDTPDALTLGPAGALYGTTLIGGAGNEGTVFELVP